MSNKTISINPSLFSIGGVKTKKNREKTIKTKIKPLISPNILKNKLLKRIKEHKNKETENLEKKSKASDGYNSTVPNQELKKYNDEFNESLDYLQTLSKRQKIIKEKENYELNRLKRYEELEKKTVKNYNSLNEPFVNVSLPDDLKEPLITVNTESIVTPTYSQPMTLRSVNDPIPYGVLKGGIKPTYRSWNKTHRNLEVTNPNASLIIPRENNMERSNRENRLNVLREKLKLKKNTAAQDNDLMMTTNLIQKPKNDTNNVSVITPLEAQASSKPLMENKINQVENNVSSNLNESKIIKRTIKRKYTLGKSKIKNSVAVLIKDRGTRKKILTAQKDLKKKSINEVKTYLRDHNLIKIGSNAPNDVIRKLYESAMLAGEITNINAETLLHNLTNDDKFSK